MDSPIIKEIQVKSILSKSNLPVCEYSVNPYVGCTHACKYCYASFMKRFTNHPEPWGEFLDVKYWAKIKNPKKYEGKELFIGSVTDPYNPQEEIYRRKHFQMPVCLGQLTRLTKLSKAIWTKQYLSSEGLPLWKRFIKPVFVLPVLSPLFFLSLAMLRRLLNGQESNAI